MGSSLTSSDSVPILRCPVLFDGTNYRDWVPRTRLHMRGLRLWHFLTTELPCPSRPSGPTELVITKTTTTEKEKLLADYEDRLPSYESQFHAYNTWLDEDARAGSVQGGIPFERLCGKTPDYSSLRLFGCVLCASCTS
jgi:hypothetical protein